jgi:hypothetical protein
MWIHFNSIVLQWVRAIEILAIRALEIKRRREVLVVLPRTYLKDIFESGC